MLRRARAQDDRGLHPGGRGSALQAFLQVLQKVQKIEGNLKPLELPASTQRILCSTFPRVAQHLFFRPPGQWRSPFLAMARGIQGQK
jgi:hypothetical protein